MSVTNIIYILVKCLLGIAPVNDNFWNGFLNAGGCQHVI